MIITPCCSINEPEPPSSRTNAVMMTSIMASHLLPQAAK